MLSQYAGGVKMVVRGTGWLDCAIDDALEAPLDNIDGVPAVAIEFCVALVDMLGQ